MALIVRPNFRDPHSVIPRGILSNDVTETAGHVLRACGEDLNKLVPLLGKGHELVDQSVHPSRPWLSIASSTVACASSALPALCSRWCASLSLSLIGASYSAHL